MAGYIGTQAVSVNTTSATISDDLTVGDDVLLTSDAAVLKIGNDADLQITHSGSAGTVTNATGDLTVDVAGDIILNANGDNIKLLYDDTIYLDIYKTGNNIAFFQDVSDGDMLFQGTDGSSAITALTLDMSDAGAATLNNGLTLTDGNLTVASGHGINFAATADGGAGSAASELFSDYEEGSWTPTAVSGGSLSLQRAVYIKIGNFVNAYCYIDLTAPNDTNNLNIGGLPFTVRNLGSYYGGGSGPSYSASVNTTSWGSPLVLPNTTTLYWHSLAGTTAVIKNNFNSGNAFGLIFNIQYFT